MLNLSWVKPQTGWYPLLGLDMSKIKQRGIYLIWTGGGPWVRVGQGDIAERITAHQNDPAINQHPNLYVTWAVALEAYLGGIERYLWEQCSPAVGERAPDVPAIAVNLPA